MNVKRLLEIRDEQKLQKKVNAVENVVKEAFESMFLDGDQRDRIISFFYFLLNTDAKKDYTSNNILINAVHYDRTVEFLRCFLAAAKRILADSNAVEKITEEDYLSHSFETMPQARLLVLDGISDLTGEKWVAKAEEMENHPETICVAITSPEKYEECKNANSHLFYRVFAQRFTIEDNTIEDICCQVAVALGREGFDYTDEFANEIGEYITTVYPKADLKGEAFVEDMVGRVKKICYSKPEVSKVLDVDCVPYYNREAEEKSSQSIQDIQPENSSQDLTVNEEKTIIHPEKVDYYMLDQNTQIDTLDIISQNNSDELRVLVLGLSIFQDNGYRDNSKYIFENGDGQRTIEVSGIYQLDPVLNMFKKQGQLFDCVIMLGTNQTIEEREVFARDYNGIIYTSPVNYFLLHQQDVASKQYDDHSQFVLCNSDEGNAEAIGQVVQLLREMSKKSNVRLYMDGHGGFRGFQVYVEAIISLLRHENISHVELYQMKYVREQKLGVISIDESTKIFNFVSGINEFINFGRMDSIEDYLANQKALENAELINRIRDISEGLQGGNVALFESGIQKLRAYRNAKKQPTDAYLRLFQQQIYEDYGKMLSDEADVRDTIRWCLRKGMIQQVLTLVESRVPELLVERGLWEITKNGMDYIAKQKADKRSFNNIELMNACINSSYIQYAWLKDDFNDIFKKERNLNDTCSEMNHYLVKKNVRYTQTIRNLQNITTKNKDTGKYEIKERNVMKMYIPESMSTKFCEFLLMHKSLKDCRNEANHLVKDSSYQLPCVKNAIVAYLEMLDDILNQWSITRNA